MMHEHQKFCNFVWKPTLPGLIKENQRTNNYFISFSNNKLQMPEEGADSPKHVAVKINNNFVN